MHEMSLTRDIVGVVLQEAQIAGAQRVLGVHLTLGEVHDIVDDLFEKCFRFMARGTIAQDAMVTITRVPLTVQCTDCGEIFPVSLYRKVTSEVVCPACGSHHYKIHSGDEFLIDDIEIAGDSADIPAMTAI